MNIKKLSKLSGINSETIRMYREKGLLSSNKLSNGYYDYNLNDFVSLAYIKKLRGYQYSLDKISDTYNTNSRDELALLVSEQEEYLKRKIDELTSKLEMLRVEGRHLKTLNYSDEEKAFEVFINNEKTDYYELENIENIGEIYPLLTPCINISQDILNGELKDEIIPIKIGVGSFTYILENNGIDTSKETIKIPAGQCVSQIITLDNLEEINIMQLAPMINYAKKHSYKYISDTSGAIINVEKVNGKLTCNFNIRARVEKIRD